LVCKLEGAVPTQYLCTAMAATGSLVDTINYK
jgi:hypothetical protein